MKSEKLNGQLAQMVDENTDKRVLRIFVCSNVNALFDANIDLGRQPWLKKLAGKIAQEYPRLYRLLCALKINKIYVRFIRGQEQKNG